MKTNFRQRNNRSKYVKVLFGALAIFLVGSGLFYFSKGILVATLSPLWNIRNLGTRNLGNALTSLRSKDSLIEENRNLKEQLEIKEAEIVLIRSFDVGTSSESFARNERSNFIKGSILLAPPLTPYDVLLIDIGEKEGVVVGNKVMLHEGSELGVITKVFTSSSEVELLTSHGKQTSAILERHMVPVQLLGRGGGNAEFEVPREIEVFPGDRIVSMQDSGGVIGVVGDVEVRPTDSFKKVLVRSVSNIHGLRSVEVLP